MLFSCIHGVSAGLEVSDKAQPELAPTVLIALELGNSCVRRIGRIKANDARASGATAGLVLNFRLLHVANRAEKFNQVLVAGGPRQLNNVLSACIIYNMVGGTHVANEDNLASFAISSRKIGECIGSHRRVLSAAESGSTSNRSSRTTATVAATTKAATASETAATAKAATTAEPSAEAATAAKAATTAKTTTHGVGESVNANLEDTTVPVVAIELLNGVASIVRGLVYNDAGTLRAPIGS